jgi:hypothetical protein
MVMATVTDTATATDTEMGMIMEAKRSILTATLMSIMIISMKTLLRDDLPDMNMSMSMIDVFRQST